MTETPETPDQDEPEVAPEVAPEVETEVAPEVEPAVETEVDIEVEDAELDGDDGLGANDDAEPAEDPGDPANYDPVDEDPPETESFQEEDMPKNAQPAIVNSKFKGVKQLVHTERGTSRVGEKENYSVAALYLFPGVNYPFDVPTNACYEARRASLCANPLAPNAVIHAPVTNARRDILSSLQGQAEGRVIALTLETGRREDLRFILENDDRPEVQQAAQDELDALKEATTQEEEDQRNQRRLRRRQAH